MQKVILIGGSPMIGKSTSAISLAAKLLYSCISTDDIGEVLQTISDINPMRDQNYLDYYAYNKKAKLIEDIVEYHKRLEPAISRLIDIHSTWGHPLIIEGWALYPKNYKVERNNVFSIWLIADSNLLRSRLIMNEGFYSNAKEPEKFTENYLYRSEWHNKTILEQCKTEKQNYLLVKEESTIDEIIFFILSMINHTY